MRNALYADLAACGAATLIPEDGLKEGRDYEFVSDGFWFSEKEAEDNLDAVICHECGRWFDGSQGKGLQFDTGGEYVDVCPACLGGHYYLDRHNTVTNLPAGYRIEQDTFPGCQLITNEPEEDE